MKLDLGRALSSERVAAKETLRKPMFRVEEAMKRYCGGESSSVGQFRDALEVFLSLHTSLLSELRSSFPVNPGNVFGVYYSLYIGASEAIGCLAQSDEGDSTRLLHDRTPSPFTGRLIDESRSHPAHQHKLLEDLVRAMSSSAVRSSLSLERLGKEYFMHIRDSSLEKMAESRFSGSFEAAKGIELHFGSRIIKGIDAGLCINKAPSSLSWDSVAGYDAQKSYFMSLQRRIDNIGEALSISGDIFTLLPNTILYGPPGTGKTLLARVFASQCKVPFYEINLAAVGSTYHDGAMLNLQSRFREAAEPIKKGISQVSVFYIDEVSSLVRERFSSNSREDDKVVEVFTSNTGEGSQVPGLMVIGSTNTIGALSKAVLSRFSILEFPAPDARTQAAIIRHYLSRYNLHSESNSGRKIFGDISPETVAGYCVHPGGARFVARDIRNVMSNLVGKVVDGALSGRYAPISDDVFIASLRDYAESKSIEGKLDYG